MYLSSAPFFQLTLFPHPLPNPHPPSSIPEIKNTPNDFYDKHKTERMGERKKRKKERSRNSYKEVFLKTFHQVPFFYENVVVEM
jgi:hypothetical protein